LKAQASEASKTTELGPARLEIPTKALSEAPIEVRYELLGKLGSGQMGEVWRARHVRLGRPCAIKVVRQDQLGENQIKRFLREARVTAGLLSPHTVQIFDFGEQAGGSLFYAMELLDGVDLQTLVRQTGPMDPERVAHLLIQACHSLEEAHHAGLVHRDLKPANLMVCRYGLEEDFVKVVDFGLVKDDSEQDEAAPNQARLTSENVVLGTAAYLAPESLKGSAHVDERADIYALGCIAYWMLTQKLVFESNVITEMVRAHLQDDPPRASATIAGLPEAFDQLIADCLAKSPEQRPRSAAAVAATLRSLEFSSPWSTERATTWWKKHRTDL
jgi:serine/threonine-protein kinase